MTCSCSCVLCSLCSGQLSAENKTFQIFCNITIHHTKLQNLQQTKYNLKDPQILLTQANDGPKIFNWIFLLDYVDKSLKQIFIDLFFRLVKRLCSLSRANNFNLILSCALEDRRLLRRLDASRCADLLNQVEDIFSKRIGSRAKLLNSQNIQQTIVKRQTCLLIGSTKILQCHWIAFYQNPSNLACLKRAKCHLRLNSFQKFNVVSVSV